MMKTAGLLGLALGAAVFAAADSAHACGGCFVAPTENSVVTGHRMALSISMKKSVLWDQIQYSGKPEEFSWVLPVKAGAKVELANDAWFEALDAATSTVVQGPFSNCGSGSSGGFGCAASADYAAAPSSADGPNGVQVLHEGTVGPYETVTLSASKADALETWLADHGYSLPDDIKPTVASYVKEGFDFIALRLIPGENVRSMRPVRVVTPGSVLGLPLRMVAAGTGAETAIKLFVLGEGRYDAKDFANPTIPASDIIWNYDTNSSNYSILRAAALASNGGKAFLTTYARKGSLLGEASDDLGSLRYQIQSPDFSYQRQATSIASAYFYQGDANGQKVGEVDACVAALQSIANSGDEVVDTCGGSANCGELANGQIAAQSLKCGELDDLAVALEGMHPGDVWVTRLEANLPRTALASDLVLQAAPVQDLVKHRHSVERAINDPCGALTVGSERTAPPSLPGGLVGFGMALTTAVWFARRRGAPVRA